MPKYSYNLPSSLPSAPPSPLTPPPPSAPHSPLLPSSAGRDRQGITSTHETYLISADTAEEADRWLTAIRRVMHEVCVCVLAVWVFMWNFYVTTESIYEEDPPPIPSSSPFTFHLPYLPPSQPYGGGMFGRSLEETMQVEARLGGNYVPVLLHRCIKFVRDQGTKFSSPKVTTFLRLVVPQRNEEALHVPRPSHSSVCRLQC